MFLFNEAILDVRKRFLLQNNRDLSYLSLSKEGCFSKLPRFEFSIP
jgi:hypothetical protein